MIRRDDSELFKMARRELFTALIGDVMDKLGMRRQFLPQPIQPLQREMVVVGRVLTVLAADFFEEVFEGSHSARSLVRSFGLMLEALDGI